MDDRLSISEKNTREGVDTCITMKLFIDTTDNTKTILRFDEKEFVREFDNAREQSLLDFLDQKLQEENKTLEELSSIEVATGPGSFTGIRVGVSIAQTLGYVLDIPVNGKNVLKDGLHINYE